VEFSSICSFSLSVPWWLTDWLTPWAIRYLQLICTREFSRLTFPLLSKANWHGKLHSSLRSGFSDTDMDKDTGTRLRIRHVLRPWVRVAPRPLRPPPPARIQIPPTEHINRNCFGKHEKETATLGVWIQSVDAL